MCRWPSVASVSNWKWPTTGSSASGTAPPTSRPTPWRGGPPIPGAAGGLPADAVGAVPGDRLALAMAADLPAASTLLDAAARIARDAGVEADAIAVVSPGPTPAATVAFDPDDPTKRAYLASTREGHRVYLSRDLTDADVVVPFGTLGFDPRLGVRGPWSVIYPGLADAETARQFHARHAGLYATRPPPRSRPRSAGCSAPSITSPSSPARGGVSGPDPRRRGGGRPSRGDRRPRTTLDLPRRGPCRRGGRRRGTPGRPVGPEEPALRPGQRPTHPGPPRARFVALSAQGGRSGRRRKSCRGWTIRATKACPPCQRRRGAGSCRGRAAAQAIGWPTSRAEQLGRRDGQGSGIRPLATPEEAARLVRQALSATFLSRADRTLAAVAE